MPTAIPAEPGGPPCGSHTKRRPSRALADAWSEMVRTTDGRLQHNHARFPSGMKALGKYIHGKGTVGGGCFVGAAWAWDAWWVMKVRASLH